MLKLELLQTDKHSIIILLRRKNLRFLRRTNHIQTRCATFSRTHNKIDNNTDKEETRITTKIIYV